MAKKQKRLTADQKVEALIEDMETWSYEALLAWAQEAREGMLKGVDEECIDHEYDNLVGDAPALVEVTE